MKYNCRTIKCSSIASRWSFSLKLFQQEVVPVLENIETRKPDRLNEVEYLLSQSLKGYHFAFKTCEIKKALGAPSNGIKDFEAEDREEVQKVFIGFVNKKTLLSKQTYLSELSKEKRQLIIKAYFNILENTLKKCITLYH